MGLTEAIFYCHASIENMHRHLTSRPLPFEHKKALALAKAFYLRGEDGARTHDLLTASQAL
jgi:hypothetical protein